MRGRRPQLKVVGVGSAAESRAALPASIPESLHGEWKTVVADLRARGLLHDAMLGVVETFILALWTVREAHACLARDGLTVKTAMGVPKANPAAALLAKGQETVARLAAELGLTPASRSRKALQPQEQGGADAWTDLDL